MCVYLHHYYTSVHFLWLLHIVGVGLIAEERRIHILNNSAFVASSSGQFGRLSCYSAAIGLHISGQWISPEGNDITLSSRHSFDVGFHNSRFSSYTTIQLRDGFSLSDADEGIYSCIIPDENSVPCTLGCTHTVIKVCIMDSVLQDIRRHSYGVYAVPVCNVYSWVSFPNHRPYLTLEWSCMCKPF